MKHNFTAGQFALLFYDNKNRMFPVSILENTDEFLRVIDEGKDYERKLLWQDYGTEWTIFTDRCDAEAHRREVRDRKYAEYWKRKELKGEK